MSERALLEQLVKVTEEEYIEAKLNLQEFDRKPEQWSYSDIEDAQGWLEEELYSRASQDCEGSHNIGDSEYRQEFLLDGKLHVAILYDIEYNRHDKTYYYIDESRFRTEECFE